MPIGKISGMASKGADYSAGTEYAGKTIDYRRVLLMILSLR